MPVYINRLSTTTGSSPNIHLHLFFSSHHYHHSFIYTRSTHYIFFHSSLVTNLIMRQALMVICAFALGKAVSAAPAARPYENPATVEYPVNSYESPTPMNYYEPSPYGSSPYSPIVYPVAPTLSYYPEPYPYSTPMAYYPPASSYYGIFLGIVPANH